MYHMRWGVQEGPETNIIIYVNYILAFSFAVLKPLEMNACEQY